MGRQRTPLCLPIVMISVATWLASSRVGASTMACVAATSVSTRSDDRNAEGTRLARAGARLHEEVAIREHVRNHRGLHGHQRSPAEFADAGEDVLGKCSEDFGGRRSSGRRRSGFGSRRGTLRRFSHLAAQASPRPQPQQPEHRPRAPTPFPRSEPQASGEVHQDAHRTISEPRSPTSRVASRRRAARFSGPRFIRPAR